MRSGPGGIRGPWVALTLGLGLAACVGGPFQTRATPEGPVLIHRELGYSIARPPWAAEPGWRSVEIEESDLAYGDEHGTLISLSARCRRTRASVAALARHVTIATERTVLHAAGPAAVGDLPAWTQTFDTVRDGVTVHVKAVTALAGTCVFDWLLVATRQPVFDRQEPAFDAWIETFRPPPGTLPATDGSGTAAQGEGGTP